jgi:prophage tail gpP-like protein
MTSPLNDLVLTVGAGTRGPGADGVAWTGWTRVEVIRRMEQCATTFRLEVTLARALAALNDRFMTNRQAPPFLPGVACRLDLKAAAKTGVATIPMLLGWIDEVSVEYDAEHHHMSISGRDVTGDLVDSAAVVDGAHEWHGLTLDAIVTRICQPFGIPVRPLVDMGPPFPRFSLQPGEEAWPAIERACRARAVLAIGDGTGGLVLTQAGMGSTPTVLFNPALAHTVGVTSTSATWSHADRHSLIVVRGQQESLGGQDDPAASAGPEARVSDPAITRWRPRVVLAEGQGSAVTLADRAAWERQVAAGRSRRMRSTVPGWTDAAGRMWNVNRPITVNDPRLALAGEKLLIVGVTLTRDEHGTRTTLEIAPQDALTPEPAADTGAEAMWQ